MFIFIREFFRAFIPYYKFKNQIVYKNHYYFLYFNQKANLFSKLISFESIFIYVVQKLFFAYVHTVYF